MPDERVPERFAEEVATVVDPLLADLWPLIWNLDPGTGVPAERVAGLLRMAYLQGYGDALEEPERGEVFRRIGVSVPPTPVTKASRTRRR